MSQELLDIARQAAQAAAEVHRKYFDTGRLDVEEKHEQSYNKVTQADIEAEAAIVEVIKEHCPDHNIFAEEQNYASTDSPYTWIVDPLDGTNNFAAGIPMFSVSIAVVKEGDVVAGVVYDPSQDELFSAVKGGGAFVNDKPIKVNQAQTLKESILITGFYYDRGEAMRTNLDKIGQFFEQHVVGVRRFGSAALDLCYVACGRAAGFWEFKLHPWDYAAGQLIVKEAGGVVTDLNNGTLPLFDHSYVVSSNGVIHSSMLQILQ